MTYLIHSRNIQELKLIRKTLVVLLMATFALTTSASSTTQASYNYVTDGSFNNTTVANAVGQLGYNTTLTSWTSTGYNFLFNPSTADSTGVTGQYGNLSLWGPKNGFNNYNNLNITTLASPDGGNFVGADANVQVGAIQQNITGLTSGSYYQLTFYWAAAQQYNFTGTVANTEAWQVSFGSSQTKTTNVVSNPTHGFSGWMQSTMIFRADGTSDVLSFLAGGSPTGAPPFVLLDGVSLVATVPEPSTVVMMGLGLLGIGGYGLRERARRRVA